MINRIKYQLKIINRDILSEPLNKGKKFKFLLNYINWNFFYKYKGKRWIVTLENGLKSIVEPYPDHDAGEVNIYTRNVDYYDILLIRTVVEKGDYVIDAGCNVGNRTLAIADKIEGAFFIDAGKTAVERTRKNIELNNLDIKKFVVLHNAVSNKKGKIYFSNLGGASTINKVVDENYSGNKDEVVVTTLDDIINTYNYNFTFIKIDVEGQDFNTLLGATQILRDKKVKLIKFEHNQEDPLEPILQLFSENDWKVFALNDEGKISEDKESINTNMNLFACPSKYFNSICAKYESVQ